MAHHVTSIFVCQYKIYKKDGLNKSYSMQVKVHIFSKLCPQQVKYPFDSEGGRSIITQVTDTLP